MYSQQARVLWCITRICPKTIIFIIHINGLSNLVIKGNIVCSASDSILIVYGIDVTNHSLLCVKNGIGKI